ncbi:TPA: LysM peptidoglycan-binding domain-containing protein, partial [Photobacterium damselae]
KVFKDAMKTGRILGFSGDVAFLFGVESNIKDVWGTCDSNDLTEECARSMIRNGTSMLINYLVGTAITNVSARLIPFSGGLSLAVGIGGNVWWGYNGGVYTDMIGDKIEYVIFDIVIDSIKEGI